MPSIARPETGDWIMIREVGDEVVALDTRANLVHQLNETASMIWRMKSRGQTAGEIAAALVATFAVDPNTAAADVVATLAALESLDLLAREEQRC